MRQFYTLLLTLTTLTLLLPLSEGNAKEVRSVADIYSKQDPMLMQIYRAEQEFMKTKDPMTGRLPENLSSGLKEFADYNLIQSSKNGNKPVTLAKGANWINRGPQNVGGRMKVIKFDVRNEDIILAGSASGGLWRSVNGGESWVKVTEPFEEQSVTALVQDTRPGKEDTWYLGTGEMLTTTDRSVELVIRSIGKGNGISKSTDNGITWSKLESTDNGAKNALTDVFQGVWKLIIDHTELTNDIVYASCYGAIMRSTDGGSSWEAVLGDTQEKCFSTDIDIASDGTLYAGLTSFTADGGSTGNTGIYKSDDGEDWELISGDDFQSETRRIKIAIAPSNEDIFYVFTEYPQNPSFARSDFTSSYHSFRKFQFDTEENKWNIENRTQFLPDSGGSSFNWNGLGTIGAYCMVLEVDPTNENTVLLGGVYLWKSINGFSNKGEIGVDHFPISLFNDPDLNLHPDVHWLEFKPSDPSKLYVGCDGGIVMTDDIRNFPVNWHQLNNGLITSQFYHVSLDKSKKTKMDLMGGLQDNNSYLTTSEDPAADWINVGVGDGMDCEIVDEGFLLASAQSGFLFYMNDDRFDISNAYMLVPKDYNKAPRLFCTFYELDPNDHNILFYPNGVNLYRQNELLRSVADTTFSENSGGWELMSKLTLGAGEYYSALCASTEPANRLYMGTTSGRVLRVDNANKGQPEFEDMTPGIFPKNAYVNCIETDPRDADKVFAVFSNYNVKSLFYSTDGGISWAEQGGNLEEGPDVPGVAPSMRWISVLPTGENSAIYFLATSTGLFSTEELAGSNTIWVQESPDLIGNVLVDNIDVRYIDNTVAIATQGNGIYTASFDISSAENYPAGFEAGMVFPNPVKNHAEFKVYSDKNTTLKYEIFDMNGRIVSKNSNISISVGANNIRIYCSGLDKGSYIINVSESGRIKSLKLIKN